MIYRSASRGSTRRTIPHAAHQQEQETEPAGPILEALLDGFVLFAIVVGCAAVAVLFGYAAWLLFIAEMVR